MITTPLMTRNIAICGLLAGLCLLPASIKLVCYPGYPGADDAFIHLAIVENIHQGLGCGINPHEPVFLSTSPLFTAFFSVLRMFTPSVLAVGMLLSSLASALYILGVFTLSRRLSGQTAWGLIAAALAATNVHLWRWNGTFMEVTFAMAAAIGLINGFLRIQDATGSRRLKLFLLTGLALAVAVLLRPELGLLCPAFLAHSALNNRRKWLADGTALAAGFALTLLPVLVSLHLCFGYITPTTATAKTTTELLWLNLPVWTQLAKTTASGCFGSLIMIGLAGLTIILRPSSLPWRNLMAKTTLLWIFPLLGFCFYSLKAPGLQSAARYFLPFMSVLPVLAAILGAKTLSANRRMFTMACSVCTLQLATALFINERILRPVLTGMMPEYVETMRRATAQIGTRANPGDTALVYCDIGVVAASRPPNLRLLDGGGLTTLEFQKKALPDMVRMAHPRFILENLGTAENYVAQSLRDNGLVYRQVWSRKFRSHSVEHRHNIYEARVFQRETPP